MGQKVAWSCHSSSQGSELISIQDVETFTAQTLVNEVPTDPRSCSVLVLSTHLPLSLTSFLPHVVNVY